MLTKTAADVGQEGMNPGPPDCEPNRTRLTNNSRGLRRYP